MSEHTAIEWADSTWSPWEGCTKVSPACDHCYAERMNTWLRKGENWGPGAPRREFSEKHWQKPVDWNAAAAKDGKRRTVFPSVCDPFDNEVSPELRARFLRLIRATPHLTWLLLTKRIGNVDRMMVEAGVAGAADGDALAASAVLPPNAWLGITICNQEEADRDITKLLATPAAVRFLSIEPMLSAIDLRRWLWTCCGDFAPGNNHGLLGQEADHCCGRPDPRDALHWVIAGSESGPRARRDPAMLDWIRSLRDQCQAAGVAFLWKQDAERGRKIPTPELDGRQWVEFPT